MWRNHAIGAFAMEAGSAAVVTGIWQARSWFRMPLTAIATVCGQIFDPSMVTASVHGFLSRSVPHGWLFLMWLVAGQVLLVWGSWGPDCDQRHSKAGRVLHLSFRHRGVTHTDYVAWIWTIIGCVEPTHLVLFFAFGWWTHLLLDEMSVLGRVHWYPFTRYRVLRHDTGDVVAKPRWRGIYHVRRPSEKRFLWLLIVINVVLSGLALGVQ